MLARRLRRRANSKQTLGQRVVFAGSRASRQVACLILVDFWLAPADLCQGLI